MPVRRLLATALLLLTAAALAWPLVAAAQTGPEELWEAYPLDPREAAPATPAPEPAEPTPVADPVDFGDDLSLPLFLAIGAGVVCLGALIGVAGVRAFRAREGPAAAHDPAPLAEPAPRSEPAPVPEPPAASRRPRAPRDEGDARDLARLAADYLDVVAAGSRRPVMDLAERRAWSVEHTRRALGRARACGLLVGAGRGRPGGALSDEAVRLLSEPAPPVPEPHHRPQAGPDPLDRADLDPAGREQDVADHVIGVASNGRGGGG